MTLTWVGGQSVTGCETRQEWMGQRLLRMKGRCPWREECEDIKGRNAGAEKKHLVQNILDQMDLGHTDPASSVGFVNSAVVDSGHVSLLICKMTLSSFLYNR